MRSCPGGWAKLTVSTDLQEFHAKCFASQEFCAENIQWATAQAEQSRAALEADLGRSSSNGSDSQHRPAPSPPPANPHPLSNDATAGAGEANPHRNSPRLSSNNPFAPIVSGEQRMPPPAPRPARETDEEQTLAILLLAYSEVGRLLLPPRCSLTSFNTDHRSPSSLRHSSAEPTREA